MTPLDAMKKALKALEETTALCINYESVEEDDGYKFTESKLVIPMGESAIANLRTTIAELESAEPVAWMVDVQTLGGDIGTQLSWTAEGAHIPGRLFSRESVPLFTHPAQPRDSIIEECAKVCEEVHSRYPTDIFPEGQSVTAQSAKMARITANNCALEIRARKGE